MNKKAYLIASFMIVAVLLFTGCTPISKPAPEPNNPEIPQHYETIHASLGEEFILHENQSAIIENSSFEIKINQFYNSPCPKNTECIWSGVGIAFEYTYEGQTQKGINLAQAFGYQTKIIDTDKETYAKLKITKIE